MSSQTKPRYGLVDRYRDRQNGLPAGRPYSITEHDITVSDGTVLKAAHYAPVGRARGTIVSMSPYGRTSFSVKSTLGSYVTQGYHLLVVGFRGTFGVAGEFDPMFHDGDDFRDAIAWMRTQPWYTGSFASAGASYLGWTQWALLAEPQPDHKAAIISVGPHDFRGFHWGTGSLTSTLPMWASLINEQERNPLRAMRLVLAKGRPVYRLLKEAPVADAIYRTIPRQTAWVRDRITHDDINAPYWEPLDQSAALERAEIPILIFSGWQDLFLAQSYEQFVRLSERGADVSFTVGPWEHMGASFGPQHAQESLEWLAARLDGTGPDRAARVHLNVTGADEWRHLDAWPPATRPHRLHLTPDALAELPASGEVSFAFDPADPPTFAGGPLLIGGGYVDDTAVARRADVLAVASAPLGADLEVHGRPVVVLDHAAEQPDSDVFVRLSDIDERGRSRNVTQGFLRTRANGEVRIELDPIAHRFRAGHRIRLAIAGGAHPHYPASPGTGENPMLAARRIPNRHTLRLADSHLELPVPRPEPRLAPGV